jgi:hypothetical protein
MAQMTSEEIEDQEIFTKKILAIHEQGLLALYFPGYSVTFLGSLIGFVYAFVLGYGVGRVIATVYNRMTATMR